MIMIINNNKSPARNRRGNISTFYATATTVVVSL